MKQVYYEDKVFNVVSESKDYFVIDYLMPQQVGYTKLTVKKSNVNRYESLGENSPEMLIFKSKFPELVNDINKNIKNLISVEKYKDYLTAVYKEDAIYCCNDQVCLRPLTYLNRRIGAVKEVPSFCLEKASNYCDVDCGEFVDTELVGNFINEKEAIKNFVKLVFEIILNDYFQNEMDI